jgi:hypothetical protein
MDNLEARRLNHRDRNMIAAEPVVVIAAFADGFLHDGWRDVIAVVGVVGVIATVVALIIGVVAYWVTLEQMRRTTSAAQAAADAAEKVKDELRESYARYLVADSSSIIREVRLYVSHEKWEMVAVRLRDLAHLVAQMSKSKGGWGGVADTLRALGMSFERVGKGEIKFKTIRGKWIECECEIGRLIDEVHAPLVVGEQRESAEEGEENEE